MADSKLHHLIALAEEPSSARRRELLREVTDLFFTVDGGPGGTEMGLFDDVMTQLETYTTGPVTRIDGTDRIDTSLNISKKYFAPGVSTVYIANALNFPDALSGAPVAGSTSSPVLLVLPDQLPPTIAAELTRLKPHRIVILGSSPSVSPAVEDQLQTYVVP